jgi:hypothetical protein
LSKRWRKQYEQTFGDKRLTLYANRIHNVKDVPRANFSPLVPRSDEFDSRLKLIGVDLPIREAQAGDTIRVVTYWESGDLANVEIALTSADGNVVATSTYPISIGAHERAEANLVIPPTVLSDLEVVAHARLRQVQIGTLHILPRVVETNASAITQALDYRLGSTIRLVGIDLPRREFHVGEPSTRSGVPITLFWKTDNAVTASYTAFVHLLGAQYNPGQNNFLWGQVDQIPLDGKLPTTAWLPGQIIQDGYSIPLQANAPIGIYKIEVGLYDAATGTRLRVLDSHGNDVGDSIIVGEIEVK